MNQELSIVFQEWIVKKLLKSYRFLSFFMFNFSKLLYHDQAERSPTFFTASYLFELHGHHTNHQDVPCSFCQILSLGHIWVYFEYM